MIGLAFTCIFLIIFIVVIIYFIRQFKNREVTFIDMVELEPLHTPDGYTENKYNFTIVNADKKNEELDVTIKDMDQIKKNGKNIKKSIECAIRINLAIALIIIFSCFIVMYNNSVYHRVVEKCKKGNLNCNLVPELCNNYNCTECIDDRTHIETNILGDSFIKCEKAKTYMLNKTHNLQNGILASIALSVAISLFIIILNYENTSDDYNKFDLLYTFYAKRIHKIKDKPYLLINAKKITPFSQPTKNAKK